MTSMAKSWEPDRAHKRLCVHNGVITFWHQARNICLSFAEQIFVTNIRSAFTYLILKPSSSRYLWTLSYWKSSMRRVNGLDIPFASRKSIEVSSIKMLISWMFKIASAKSLRILLEYEVLGGENQKVSEHSMEFQIQMSAIDTLWWNEDHHPKTIQHQHFQSLLIDIYSVDSSQPQNAR